MSDCPADLKYVKTHEWIRDNGDGTVTVGITHREGTPQHYRLEVRNGVHLIGAAGPISSGCIGT